MKNQIKLKEYLDEIRKCEDPDSLRNELKIYDNWPVLLYGNQDELFSKVTQAFRDSPKLEGIQDSWHYVGNCREGRTQLFDYDLGTVHIQINRCSHGMWMSEEDKINSLYHSVWVMFHPYQKKKMENVSNVRAMALAIASFGEYVIRENLTARFPKNGLDLNYIPD
jgi:hypothetical protein